MRWLLLLAVAAIIGLLSLMVVAEAAIPTPPLADDSSLVLRFSFDIYDLQITDDSGNGNDGTVYGATSVEGRYGRALSFDGVGGYIGFSSPIFNLPTQITFAAWIKYDELKDRNQVIFYHNEKGFFTVHIDKNGKLGANVRDESGQWFGGSAPTILEAGKWYFVCIVWDGQTGYIKYYVNGQLVDTKSYPAGSPIFAGSTGVLPLIGAYYTAETLIDFFDGIIDELRIYSIALSDSEIQQMYEALRVKFYDESSGEKIAANATIFNTNYSITLQTDEVTKEAVLFNADLPESGEYYLISSATDYIERYRIVQFDEYGGEEVNVYLANANDAVLNKIEIIDLTNSFLNGIFTLKSGDKTIEEKRIYQNELNVWFLPDRFYSVYIANSEETRNLGFISYDADGVIQLYITPLTMSYVNYTGPIAYNYTYNSTTGIITLEYNTTSGDTTSVIFKVYDENGTELYNASATTPSGRFTYTGEANRTYIIELYADNSLQPLNFKVVVLPAENAVQISVNVEPITTLPEWIRAVFFGGLLIFISIMFKKTHVPVGLILSLTLAVVFTTTGIVTLPNEVLVVLGLITALSLFIWWREDKQVEVR